MNLFLRFLFSLVIVSMLGIIAWATWQCPLFAIPREVLTHPWFIATLADAYWAFIVVFVWVAWKEGSWGARVLWFIAIILLGNVAIGAYFLRELFSVPRAGPIDPVFTRRNPGTLVMPGLLAAAAVGVYLLG